MSQFGHLLLANRGNVGFGWGQSNMNDCGNMSGASALVKPANATFWDFDKSTVAARVAYHTHHSLEDGLFDEVCTVNGIALTFVKHGRDGTALSAWSGGHCDTFKTAYAAAALPRPKWCILAQGENEAAAAEGTANAWDPTACMAEWREAYGAGLGIIMVLLHPGGTGTWTSNVRARQAIVAAGHWHIGTVETSDLSLSADNLHWSGAMATEVGRRCGRLLISSGIVS